MKQLISAFIFSRLDYCNVILSGLPLSTIAPLHRVQNAAARLLMGLSRRDHVHSALKELHWKSFTGYPWCTESSSSWLWWCSRCTLDSAQIISAVLYKHGVAIRLGFVSAQRPASIIQFHVQERNLATEPSQWPGQSYGTVSMQQFVTQTLLARSSANSKLTFFYVLRRCLIFINWLFAMHSWSGLK